VVCVERTCQAHGADHCLFELLPAAANESAPVVALDPDPALGKRLSLLETLFDRMPMGLAIFDRDFRIRRYNPTWASYADLYAAPSAVPIRPGDYYFDFLPGTESTVLPLFERVLAGETLRFEGMRLESVGIVSYWDVVLAPTFEGDEVTGILNVTIDATDRVEAHQQLERTVATLQEREERLALVMEGINDGIWDWDVQTGEVYFSPRWKSMLGYTDQEIPHRFESWEALIHPDDRQQAVDAIARHFAGHTPLYSLEHRLRHKNGEYRWILARGKAVLRADGHPARVVGSHTDIHERKLAEANLEESQRRLSTLIGNLPGMAYRCRNDTHWTMEFVSEGSLPLTGYPAADLIDNHHLSYGDLIHPDDRDLVWTEVQAGLEERRPFRLSYRIITPGGEKWVWEQGQGVCDSRGDVVAIEGFITDITERVTAQHYLEQRVDERTRELSTLLDVTHDINSRLEIDSLLELILDQLKTVVDYTGASILTLVGDRLAVRAYRGPIDQQEVLALRFALDDLPANREVIDQRAPLCIPDVRADTHMARLFQQGAGDNIDTTFGYVRSWLGVPLTVKHDVIGMLTLDHDQVGFFTEQHAYLVAAFANQVAVAIENARLYHAEQEQFEESERRRRVAESLRDILDVLNSDRSLSEVLDFIVAQSRRLLGAEAALIRQVDFAAETVTSVASSNLHPDFEVGHTTRLYYSERDRTLIAHQPVIRPDLLAEGPAGGIEDELVDDVVRAWIAAERKHYRSVLTAPVFRQDEVYGSLRFYFAEPRAFSDEDVQLAMMLGDHAALAIENARLRTQAQEAAVAAERNRLARDLHDAVTQTLFSSSLIAEVLPRIWAKDHQEGERRLAELRELTRGALAEMRALLL
ncbi:MAG TPA: PAS domain-containing protein, partial [Anaerolineae bacterium]|nr:PAS domain-containing protein [Anaerolineae bacterium]